MIEILGGAVLQAARRHLNQMALAAEVSDPHANLSGWKPALREYEFGTTGSRALPDMVTARSRRTDRVGEFSASLPSTLEKTDTTYEPRFFLCDLDARRPLWSKSLKAFNRKER